MDVLVEQHYVIKFCVPLEKNTVETILLLQEAFLNNVLGVLAIKWWHKMFLDDKELKEFEPHGGKLKTVHSDNYQYRYNCH